MHGRVTSKPWSIVNENDKTRSNAKSLFRNLLQLSSPTPPTNILPENIGVSVVDAMRVVKMIPIKKTSPRTFRGWGKQFFDYMKQLPGCIIHIVFDNYGYEYHVPSKDRSDGALRLVTNIDQELPHNNDWVDFLGNSENRIN